MNLRGTSTMLQSRTAVIQTCAKLLHRDEQTVRKYLHQYQFFTREDFEALDRSIDLKKRQRKWKRGRMIPNEILPEIELLLEEDYAKLKALNEKEKLQTPDSQVAHAWAPVPQMLSARQRKFMLTKMTSVSLRTVQGLLTDRLGIVRKPVESAVYVPPKTWDNTKLQQFFISASLWFQIAEFSGGFLGRDGSGMESSSFDSEIVYDFATSLGCEPTVCRTSAEALKKPKRCRRRHKHVAKQVEGTQTIGTRRCGIRSNRGITSNSKPK